MDTFARLPAVDRATYFREAAARMGLPPHIVEKDFWVCWTLKRLFSLESLKEHLLFKGGTSLSKAYRLIRRFSEDIDISMQRESLGFGGEKDPANPKLSNKARTRQVDALADAAKSQIFEKVFPELDQMIRNQGLNEDCTLTKDDADSDQQSLAFAYPPNRTDAGCNRVPSAIGENRVWCALRSLACRDQTNTALLGGGDPRRHAGIKDRGEGDGR